MAEMQEAHRAKQLKMENEHRQTTEDLDAYKAKQSEMKIEYEQMKQNLTMAAAQAKAETEKKYVGKLEEMKHEHYQMEETLRMSQKKQEQLLAKTGGWQWTALAWDWSAGHVRQIVFRLL